MPTHARFPSIPVLVVDDEEAIRTVLEARLSAWGLDVVSAADLASAERFLKEFQPKIVVTDVMLPDGTGVDLLDHMNAQGLDLPVILITAHGSVELAVEAMKKGALDFLTKPLDYERLSRSLEAAQAARQSRRRSTEVAFKAPSTEHFGRLVGSSRPLRQVFAVLSEIAATDAPVLLTGESGTGKELAARALHDHSRRHGKPFIAVNSAAIPKELMESEIFGHEKGAFTGATDTRQGCFELANGGTLFLDEIAEMPIELQPKLLRVLEDGRVRRVGSTRNIQVDVRVVAATNRPPADALKRNLLREDLYYRLNVFEVDMPPLRERQDDIPLLVNHFVTQLNKRHGTQVSGISTDAFDRLASHSWPGNVRELRNVMERAVVLTKQGEIESDQLPASLTNTTATHSPALSSATRKDSHPRRSIDPQDDETVSIPVGTSIADAEKELVLRTLDQTNNNKAAAARRLGIDVRTIRNKLNNWGIDR